MDTVKIKKSKEVFMIAHRGLSGLETENTNSAFVAAGNRSYYGIETDVHVTADGKFVIIHDDSTSRVADVDVEVEKTTFEELKKICLKDIRKGAHETPYVRCDLLIPSLSEYVGICKKYNKKCVLELKNPFAEADIKNLISEIEALGYSDNMIYISFSPENLVTLRKLLPEASLQYLVKDYRKEVLDVLNLHSLDLDIYYKSLTKDIVAEIHKNGHKVNCWTCDDANASEQLISWGVDYITSNILE